MFDTQHLIYNVYVSFKTISILINKQHSTEERIRFNIERSPYQLIIFGL